MNFDALSEADRDSIVTGHLRQAEADWLVNILNARKAKAAAAIEPDANKRAELMAQAKASKAAAARCLSDIGVVKAVAADPAKLDADPTV